MDGTHGSAVAGLHKCVAQQRAHTPKPVWNPDLPESQRFRRYALVGREIIDTLHAVQRYDAVVRHMRHHTLKNAARYFGVAREDIEAPGWIPADELVVLAGSGGVGRRAIDQVIAALQKDGLLEREALAGRPFFRRTAAGHEAAQRLLGADRVDLSPARTASARPTSGGPSPARRSPSPSSSVKMRLAGGLK